MQWEWVNTSLFRFQDLRHALVKIAAQDGFEIQFVILAGAESAHGFAVERSGSGEQVPSIIFSGTMRTVENFNKDGEAKAAQSFGEWSETKEGDEKPISKITQCCFYAFDVLTLLYPQKARSIVGSLAQAAKPTDEIVLQHLIVCLDASEWSLICNCVNGSLPASLQYISARNVPGIGGGLRSIRHRRIDSSGNLHAKSVCTRLLA